MTNSTDPEQLASSEANRSGATLFAKAGYIQVQQDNFVCVEIRVKSSLVSLPNHTFSWAGLVL